jgi:hypothetical protein
LSFVVIMKLRVLLCSDDKKYLTVVLFNPLAPEFSFKF